MMYTLLVLFSGIYLGQEYVIIPSIRIIGINMFVYLQSLKEPERDIESVMTKLYKFFR